MQKSLNFFLKSAKTSLRNYSTTMTYKDIWFCRPGFEKILSYQLTTDHKCSVRTKRVPLLISFFSILTLQCNVKSNRIESSSLEEIKDASPFAYQRMPNYHEVKNRDVDQLAMTLYNLMSESLQILDPSAMWDLHTLRTFFLLVVKSSSFF